MAKLPAPTTPCRTNLLGLVDCTSGLAVKAQARTVEALVAALTVAFFSFSAQLVAFWLLRRRLPRIYLPRTYEGSGTVDRRPVDTRWSARLRRLLTPVNEAFYNRHGLEAFFFLRYLEMLIKIFVPATLLGLPLLLPLNIYGGNGNRGLNQLTMSNIAPSRTSFLWAHLGLGLLFVAWSCAVLSHELRNYVRVRHRYLKNARACATTVLIRDIPSQLLREDVLADFYGDLPGGVRRVWINRDVRDLSRKVMERVQITEKLEAAETALIKLCNRTHDVHTPDGAPAFKSSTCGSLACHVVPAKVGVKRPAASSPHCPTWHSTRTGHVCDANCTTDDMDEPMWQKLIPTTQRETLRLPWLSFWRFRGFPFGAKVDRISYLRCQLARLNADIDCEHEKRQALPCLTSAFVRFHRADAASLCSQAVAHSMPHCMTALAVEEDPRSVLWNNVGLTWWERRLRIALVFGLLSLMVALYSIPIALSSFLNNIELLAEMYSWLAWVQRAPAWLIATAQGGLPPVLLSILLAIVPMAMRCLVQLEGVATTADRERHVQMWYFSFLFVQVFVIVTLSSSLVYTVASVPSDGLEVLQRLSTNIPKASTFFFSYLSVDGLSTAAAALLQWDSLSSRLLYARLCDRTPREKWRRQTTLRTLDVGSVLPPVTNLAVLALIYSVLSPLILAFAVVVFAVFTFVYRYNTQHVYHCEHSSGGFFPVAVNQTFIGLYVLQFCLVGHFFAQSDNGRPVCIPQGLVVVISMIVTLLFHRELYVGLRPLLRFKPMARGDSSEPNLVSVEDEREIGPADGTAPAKGCVREEEDTFQQPALRARAPIVWLPHDEFGISENEISRAKERHAISSATLSVDGVRAFLDTEGRVTVQAGSSA